MIEIHTQNIGYCNQDLLTSTILFNEKRNYFLEKNIQFSIKNQLISINFFILI